MIYSSSFCEPIAIYLGAIRLDGLLSRRQFGPDEVRYYACETARGDSEVMQLTPNRALAQRT